MEKQLSRKSSSTHKDAEEESVMPKFNYVALDAKGKEISGVLETDNTTSAVSRIREMGYFPTNVTEADKGKRAGKPAAPVTAGKPEKKGFGQLQLKFLSTGKIKSKALTAFTRQLATLIDAGLPLLRGLSVLRRQEKNPTLKKTLVQLSEAVEGGSTFSEALAQHPKIFNRLYVNMVRAGEAGGVLDVTLSRLADFQEKAQKIKNKVISAMVYPVVVICVAVGILSFLMVVIVPKFKEIFSDLLEGKELPVLTQVVITVSNLMKDRILIVLPVLIAIFIAIKLVGKTTKGRFLLDTVKLNAPVFGSLVRRVGISRFTRTLGTLIASGVPILQALNIVRETSGNAVIAKAVGQVHDSVKEGESIVQPLEASKVFPPMVVSMIEVGEETGALPDMLMKIADVYDDEVDNAVAALTSLLEPIMIVFLALIVGTIVIALFLPLISIIGTLGQ
jgi:type IV pilus assembly protein PilC